MSEKKNNSMFLYTALIFIVAIIIIILAFLAQTHIDNSRPSQSLQTDIAEHGGGNSELQGIQKSASQLSSDYLALLEENRSLNKRLDTSESENMLYKKLLAANGYLSVDNIDMAKALISEIDYNLLNSDGQILFDAINGKINENINENNLQ